MRLRDHVRHYHNASTSQAASAQRLHRVHRLSRGAVRGPSRRSSRPESPPRTGGGGARRRTRTRPPPGQLWTVYRYYLLVRTISCTRFEMKLGQTESNRFDTQHTGHSLRPPMHPRQLLVFHSSTGRHADCTAGSKGRGAQREALRGGPGERGRGDKRRWEEEGSGRLCVARARVITPLGPSSSSCRPFSQLVHPTVFSRPIRCTQRETLLKESHAAYS